MLGEIYEYGQGVSRDYAKAAYWYQKAANQDIGPLKAIAIEGLNRVRRKMHQ